MKSRAESRMTDRAEAEQNDTEQKQSRMTEKVDAEQTC
jgi:hypothetical protein